MNAKTDPKAAAPSPLSRREERRQALKSATQDARAKREAQRADIQKSLREQTAQSTKPPAPIARQETD